MMKRTVVSGVFLAFAMLMFANVACVWAVSAIEDENTEPNETSSTVQIFEEQASKARAPIFPEPMVFDLVRPLGAAKGELEANTLLIAPLRRSNFGVMWAPEVEWAFMEGHAIELELPMYNGEVEAYKLAFQGTFSYTETGSFIHGWQWISEYLVHERVMESTLLYLAGFDLGNNFSLFGMVGGRNNALVRGEFMRPESEWNFLTNISFNATLSPGFVLSVETNYARHLGLGNELLVIPQVHYRISPHFNLQFGVGHEWYINSRRPIFSCRIIREF